MYIKEIISLIEDYAPLKLQASFDNSGLLCGERNGINIHTTMYWMLLKRL